MKKRNGFTLVELLAVIVILAIILVIAVPQITKTIKNARMGALGSSAKLIASTAEREKLLAEAAEDATFDPTNLDCSDLAPSETTIGECKVAFGTGDNADTAYVTLNGKADTSYKDFHICDATKASATVSETACTGTVAVLSGGSQQGGGN